MTAPATLSICTLTALAEIASGRALWAWWRLVASALWMAPRLVSLVVFTWLLALAAVAFYGRAHLARGGVGTILFSSRQV